MHIHLFPRPSADTGIGLHWSTGRSQLPIEQIRSFWIPQLRALGVAWVKLNDHRDSLPLVEALLAAGIQPIVRVYRPAPNPDPLGAEELAAVEQLIRAGVRYFEVNHRPDLPAQWRSGVLPPDAPAQVARHLAQDLEQVLERGGLPALPALAPGSGWDLPAELLRLGKRDILQGPIWQAIHTPGQNRPPDFPADPVHRDGAPLTQTYFLALAEETWEGDAWQGRSLAEVNRLRRRAALARQADPRPDRPDRADAETGLFTVGALHARHMELLGRAIPILSTSGGYVVGAAQDPRYPAVTPALHMAYTLEACRVMMGSSTRQPPAPDYFFCTTFWLLANRALESSRPARENDAWYSPEHPDGCLPIVPLLQAEPKRLRHAPQIAPAEPAHPQPRVSAALTLFSPASRPGKGAITGKVRGGSSVDLRLVSLEDGLLLQTVARSNGEFRFVDLPPGRYSVWVENPPGSRRGDIVIDGDETVAIDLAVDGWGYEVSEEPDGRAGMLQCSLALTADMAAAPSLRLRWVGGERVLAMVRSGKDRIARCSAGPLEAGSYDLELLGIPDSVPGDLRATIPVSRSAETHVHFVHSRVSGNRKPPTASAIEGRIANGGSVQVTLQNGDGRKRNMTADPNGSFRFPGLAPGSYSLTVGEEGRGIFRTRLGVDGEHTLLVGLEAPVAAPALPRPRAALEGDAPGQAGRRAVLVGSAGALYRRRIDEAGRFRFDNLPAGTYGLTAGNFQAAGLDVRAREVLAVTFPPLGPLWQVDVRGRSTLRRPGLVRVQVIGRTGAEVSLWGRAGPEQRRPTGSAIDYGPFAVEFGPLEPGPYRVQVEGVDSAAEFVLESTDSVAITFQRRTALAGPPRLERHPLS